MNKVIYLLIASALFVSCEKEKATLDRSTLEMNYKEKDQLRIKNTEKETLASWASEDEFIATVDMEGVVTGKHVGTTLIIATIGDEQLVCEIKVDPVLELYEKPIVKFNKCREYIKENEKRIIHKESESFLIYKDSNAVDIQYRFKYNKLTSVAVRLDLYSTEPDDIIDFLTERYDIANEQGNYFIWEKEEMEIVVAREITGYYVIYTELSSAKSLNR